MIDRLGLGRPPRRETCTDEVAEVIEEQGKDGGRSVYLVDFDRPQLDSDGGGSYSTSEIDAKYLRAVP